MSELSLRTTLEPFGPACAIILTDDQVRELGGGKRAAVRVSIDGRTTALRLAVMGGVNCIGLSKAARADLGVEIGQQVDAVVALDETPREVEIPAELAEALSGDLTPHGGSRRSPTPTASPSRRGWARPRRPRRGCGGRPRRSR